MLPESFLGVIEDSRARPEHRSVMARVMLNLLFDPQQFPVEIREVEALSGKEYALTHSFMRYCLGNPEVLGASQKDLIQRIKAVLRATLARTQWREGAEPKATCPNGAEGEHS